MRKETVLALVAATLAAFLPAPPAAAQLSLPRPSQKGVVSQTVGVTEITVTYSRPVARGRKVWGDPVEMDKLWRTGANEATTIAFTDDVTIDGKKIPAGKYSVFTIPGKEEWTFILNGDPEAGTSEYKQEKDVLRTKVKPEAVPMTEVLTFGFPLVTADSAHLALKWEKVKVSVPIQVDTKGIVVKKAKEAIAKAKPDDWATPLRASRWARESKLPEADEWLERSIAAKPALGNLSDKAKLLAEQGKRADAIVTAEKALAAAKTQEPKPSAEAVAAVEKLIADWKAKK